MVSKLPYGRINVNVCQFCGCDNSDMAEKFWVDIGCTICSTCAPGRHVIVVRNKYTRPPGNFNANGQRLWNPITKK